MVLVQLKNIKQRIDPSCQSSTISANMEEIAKYFPIESKQEVDHLEKLLNVKKKEDEFVSSH